MSKELEDLEARVIVLEARVSALSSALEKMISDIDDVQTNAILGEMGL